MPVKSEKKGKSKRQSSAGSHPSAVGSKPGVAIPPEGGARYSLYRLLSLGFLYPSDELFALLSTGGYWDAMSTAVSAINPAASEMSPEGSEPLDVYVQPPPLLQEGAMMGKAWVIPSTLEELQEEYTGIFTHTISTEVPPYGTQYGKAHIFQQAQALADLQGFYHAFGLQVSSQAKERPDFLPIELEFMGFLIQKEAYALQHHGEEEVKICRDAQKKFLTEYLAPWLPAFVRRLGEKAGRGFYLALAGILEGFMDLEMRRFRIALPVGSADQWEALPLNSFPCGEESGTCGLDDGGGCFLAPGDATETREIRE